MAGSEGGRFEPIKGEADRSLGSKGTVERFSVSARP